MKVWQLMQILSESPAGAEVTLAFDAGVAQKHIPLRETSPTPECADDNLILFGGTHDDG